MNYTLGNVTRKVCTKFHEASLNRIRKKSGEVKRLKEKRKKKEKRNTFWLQIGRFQSPISANQAEFRHAVLNILLGKARRFQITRLNRCE